MDVLKWMIRSHRQKCFIFRIAQDEIYVNRFLSTPPPKKNNENTFQLALWNLWFHSSFLGVFPWCICLSNWLSTWVRNVCTVHSETVVSNPSLAGTGGSGDSRHSCFTLISDCELPSPNKFKITYIYDVKQLWLGWSRPTSLRLVGTLDLTNLLQSFWILMTIRTSQWLV